MSVDSMHFPMVSGRQANCFQPDARSTGVVMAYTMSSGSCSCGGCHSLI